MFWNCKFWREKKKINCLIAKNLVRLECSPQCPVYSHCPHSSHSRSSFSLQYLSFSLTWWRKWRWGRGDLLLLVRPFGPACCFWERLVAQRLVVFCDYKMTVPKLVTALTGCNRDRSLWAGGWKSLYFKW